MAEGTDRHSKAGEDREVAKTPDEIARIEARNALRQFDRMREMIGEALASRGSFRLRPSAILELNRLAIQDLHPRAGAYRTVPIEIGGASHQPPDAAEVPRYVDDLCDFVNNRPYETPLFLASYIMWRLNWIHPFYDGNGRTTRAVSYLVLCARLGYEVNGTKTVPEVIAENKFSYYDALEEADKADLRGEIDLAAMETVLSNALAAQLLSVVEDATSTRRKRS